MSNHHAISPGLRCYHVKYGKIKNNSCHLVRGKSEEVKKIHLKGGMSVD